MADDFNIEKERIASSFSCAATTYDTYAGLQRGIADQLLNKISVGTKPVRILDLGSGTGYYSGKLLKIFPKAEIINLDISEGMLSYSKVNETSQTISHVCADAEAMPFQSNSFDLIVSSLTIQWCKKYSQLFLELQRILNINGSAYLSSFGYDTLQELKYAWHKVDKYVHVNEFVSKEYLKLVIKNNKFSIFKIEENPLIRYYSTLFELTRELKGIGAHNMNHGQQKGLTGRKKIIKLKNCFDENYISGKGIPVTYAVQYIYLKK